MGRPLGEHHLRVSARQNESHRAICTKVCARGIDTLPERLTSPKFGSIQIKFVQTGGETECLSACDNCGFIRTKEPLFTGSRDKAGKSGFDLH